MNDENKVAVSPSRPLIGSTRHRLHTTFPVRYRKDISSIVDANDEQVLFVPLTVGGRAERQIFGEWVADAMNEKR